MSSQKLDLHPIYNKGSEIEFELRNILNAAWNKRMDFIEIIPGKGSGALKNKVLRFFNQKHIRQKYSRLVVDNKNFGKIILYFNWNKLICSDK
jgi:DNA-nicking Smr family endonuclease